MMKLIKRILAVVSILLLAFVVFYFWASSGQLSEDQYSTVRQHHNNFSEFKPETGIISIMTYNIGYLSGMTNNRPVARSKEMYDKNLSEIIQLIKIEKPDLIGMQEVDFKAKRSFFVDQPKMIATGYGLRYEADVISWDKKYVPWPYWPLQYHFGEMVSGQTILSRFPIESHERIVLSKPVDAPFFYNAFYLDRLVEIVKVNVGVEIIIINVHLEAFDKITRQIQAKRLVEITKGYVDKYPTILLGDFNSIPPETRKFWAGKTKGKPDRTIEILREGSNMKSALFFASPEKNTPGYATFPSDYPKYKLDYIFYTPDRIQKIDGYIPQNHTSASDHLPVVMKFKVIP